MPMGRWIQGTEDQARELLLLSLFYFVYSRSEPALSIREPKKLKQLTHTRQRDNLPGPLTTKRSKSGSSRRVGNWGGDPLVWSGFVELAKAPLLHRKTNYQNRLPERPRR